MVLTRPMKYSWLLTLYQKSALTSGYLHDEEDGEQELMNSKLPEKFYVTTLNTN